jgi:hypothetical protein
VAVAAHSTGQFPKTASHEYVEEARMEKQKESPLFRSTLRKTKQLTANGMSAVDL